MKRISSLVWWMTACLLVISATMNVVQAGKLRAAAEAGKAPDHIGEAVASFRVTDRNAVPQELRFDRGVPTVLYYFSASCGWCERNWNNVRELARASAGRYRVVALTKDKLSSEFLSSHELPFEVYGDVPESTRRALSLSGTPVTVVVSPEGRVSHEWAGAFSGTSQKAIESLFDVRLPGLSVGQRSEAPRR